MPATAGKATYTTVMTAIVGFDEATKRKILARLKKLVSTDTLTVDQFIADLRDRRFRKGLACPHCHNEKIIRYGKPKGRQNYWCDECKRKFSDHTHTPFRGTHYPEKWLPFMEHMVNGYSIRKSAKLLGVAESTVFTWRHKVLDGLARMEPGDFEGLLEVDETYFRYSEKGNKHIVGRKPRKRGTPAEKRGISREQVCVVVARDRNKLTHAQVACLGPVSKVKAHTLLDPHLKGVSALCSDANGTWKAIAGDVKIDHKELNMKQGRRVLQGIYHIQNVNAFHSRLKGWMDRFKGVASKFLNNYLAWFRFIDAHGREAMTAKKLELLLLACLPISPERYFEIRNTRLVLP